MFQADAPNCIWVADITYVPTWAGFLYLAVVLDVFSRKVVGWAMANHLRTELVLEALNMAIAQRRPQGVIHHSDKGAQYTSLAFGKRCREMGIVTSTGSAGDCYDNAMAESFFATLECELIDRRSFRTHAEAAHGHLRVPRILVQPPQIALRAGVPEPQRIRTSRGRGGAPDGHRGSSRTNHPRALPGAVGRGSHNHPLGRPPSPVSEKDSLPSAIVHLSAGDDSPQPSTETG